MSGFILTLPISMIASDYEINQADVITALFFNVFTPWLGRSIDDTCNELDNNLCTRGKHIEK